jgi:hypothetical protein
MQQQSSERWRYLVSRAGFSKLFNGKISDKMYGIYQLSRRKAKVIHQLPRPEAET